MKIVENNSYQILNDKDIYANTRPTTPTCPRPLTLPTLLAIQITTRRYLHHARRVFMTRALTPGAPIPDVDPALTRPVSPPPHTHTHTHRNTRTHTPTHAQTHARARTRTHAHTHLTRRQLESQSVNMRIYINIWSAWGSYIYIYTHTHIYIRSARTIYRPALSVVARLSAIANHSQNDNNNDNKSQPK